MVKIGIIGGSGLDNPDILQNARDIPVDTPYGALVSPLRRGRVGDKDVFILARHGREHTQPPTQVNFRANIWALKQAGCQFILATTAVGSLRQEIERGHLVVLDQFIDFTRHRSITFHDYFEPENAQHTPMADPFDERLRGLLIAACKKCGVAHHERGTVVTIEGPRFSTRAESNMFRLWGADVINMSIAPEAILANEAGVPYAAIAMSTDYDCWKTDEPPVTWEDILRIFKENAENVTRVLVEAVKGIG
jgi:5'-methylthioadenosine phosphorylase